MAKGGWIFISHSHQDVALVRKIRNHLEKLGFEPLMFYLKCLSDENEIETLIKREIDEREWFIYADSPNARESKWVKTEREHIEKTVGKKIFVINLQSNIDEQLRQIEHIARQMKVFISYTRKDVNLFHALKEKLTQDDFEQECELDCKITAYIPDDYIDYPNARMDCYKRISQIKSLQDKQTLYSELQSVFGAIPSQVNNLIEIAYLKVLCKQVGVVKALVSLEGARLDFSCLDCLKDGKIISKVNENSCFVSLSIQDKPSIIFNKKVSSAEERLIQVINFLK